MPKRWSGRAEREAGGGAGLGESESSRRSGGQQCCSGGSSLTALGFYCNNRSFLFTVVACGDFFPFRITVDHLWALDHH